MEDSVEKLAGKLDVSEKKQSVVAGDWSGEGKAAALRTWRQSRMQLSRTGLTGSSLILLLEQPSCSVCVATRSFFFPERTGLQSARKRALGSVYETKGSEKLVAPIHHLMTVVYYVSLPWPIPFMFFSIVAI